MNYKRNGKEIQKESKESKIIIRIHRKVTLNKKEEVDSVKCHKKVTEKGGKPDDLMSLLPFIALALLVMAVALPCL